MRAVRDIRARPLRRVVRLVVLAAMERGLGVSGQSSDVWRGREGTGFWRAFVSFPLPLLLPTSSPLGTKCRFREMAEQVYSLHPSALSHSPALCLHSPAQLPTPESASSPFGNVEFSVWALGWWLTIARHHHHNHRIHSRRPRYRHCLVIPSTTPHKKKGQASHSGMDTGSSTRPR